MQKCSNCPQEGRDLGFVLTAEEAVDITLEVVGKAEDPDSLPNFLFATGAGLFCFVCLCGEKSVCLVCLEEAENMVRDVRCDKNPLVCRPCALSPSRNHLYSCLGDGCMTPGEFAQNEYETDMMFEHLTPDEDEDDNE